MNATVQVLEDGAEALVAARPRGAELSAAELRSFLELGAAQLESAMKDSDARVASLTSAVSHVVERLTEVHAIAAELNGDADPRCAALADRLSAVSAELELDARQAVVALQFYDKMIQRITHVRDGLTIHAEVIEAGPQQRSAAWNQLLEEVRFDMAFMFKYSERPKTLAARKYPDDVPEEVKARRLQEVIAVVNRTARENNQAQVGQVQEVLIEGVSKRSAEHFYGRNDRYTTVILPKDDLQAGDFVKVRILSATASSLQAEVLSRIPHPGAEALQPA